MKPLSDPFDSLLRLQRALAGESRGARAAPVVFPPVNVFTKGDDYVVVAEVPGMRKEELVVEASGNRLRIAGVKRPLYGENVGVHRQERVSGAFDRTVTLPMDIDPDGIKAEYRDGILAVFAPPAEHARPRTIRVQ